MCRIVKKTTAETTYKREVTNRVTIGIKEAKNVRRSNRAAIVSSSNFRFAFVASRHLTTLIAHVVAFAVIVWQ